MLIYASLTSNIFVVLPGLRFAYIVTLTWSKCFYQD